MNDNDDMETEGLVFLYGLISILLFASIIYYFLF